MLRGREVERGPFGAKPPEIGRVLGVAAHVRDASGFGLDQYAAADAAVGAGGGGFHGGKSKQSVCHLRGYWGLKSGRWE